MNQVKKYHGYKKKDSQVAVLLKQSNMAEGPAVVTSWRRWLQRFSLRRRRISW
jgi:hypothetical protein